MNANATMRRLLQEQCGQVLPWFVILTTLIFAGLCALVIDIGRAVVAYHMLQAATDAAVMAGAQAMPSATSNTTVTSQATLFSAVPGNKNASASMLPNATMATGYPALYCSSTVLGWGVLPNASLTQTGTVPSASGCGSSGTGANAIVVAEQVTIPFYFGSIIGFPSITLTAKSTAAMKGSARLPYNVAIIVDTTDSMNSTDGNTKNCGSLTRLGCSLEGVIQLLGDLTPCKYGTTCGSSFTASGNNAENVGSPFDEVALYTFPGVASGAYATDDASANGKFSKSDISDYTYPTYPTYQIVGYSSNYANSDPSTVTASGSESSAVNNSSLLAEAAGAGIPAKSPYGLTAYGGAGTYYAGIITAAQADLVAQQATRAAAGVPSQNVMIILSDGDSPGSTASFTAGSYAYNYTGTTSSPSANAGIPSPFNMCEQSVAAAQAATHAGTIVYSVAYGSQTTGCATDSTTSFTTSNGTAAATSACTAGSSGSISCNNPISGTPPSNCSINASTKKETCSNTTPSGLTPCKAMSEMASSPSTFFSDYVAGGNGSSNDSSCVGSNGSDTSLDDIFSFIAGSLETARLMPNGTP